MWQGCMNMSPKKMMRKRNDAQRLWKREGERESKREGERARERERDEPKKVKGSVSSRPTRPSPTLERDKGTSNSNIHKEWMGKPECPGEKPISQMQLVPRPKAENVKGIADLGLRKKNTSQTRLKEKTKNKTTRVQKRKRCVVINESKEMNQWCSASCVFWFVCFLER